MITVIKAILIICSITPSIHLLSLISMWVIIIGRLLKKKKPIENNPEGELYHIIKFSIFDTILFGVAICILYIMIKEFLDKFTIYTLIFTILYILSLFVSMVCFAIALSNFDNKEYIDEDIFYDE